MTDKAKKAKRRKRRSRPGRVIELRASVEDDLLSLADGETGEEARWNRPRKRRISLRVDTEVGRLVQVQRPGLPDAHQPDLEKSDDGGQETDGREITRNSGQTGYLWFLERP